MLVLLRLLNLRSTSTQLTTPSCVYSVCKQDSQGVITMKMWQGKREGVHLLMLGASPAVMVASVEPASFGGHAAVTDLPHTDAVLLSAIPFCYSAALLQLAVVHSSEDVLQSTPQLPCVYAHTASLSSNTPVYCTISANAQAVAVMPSRL